MTPRTARLASMLGLCMLAGCAGEPSSGSPARHDAALAYRDYCSSRVAVTASAEALPAGAQRLRPDAYFSRFDARANVPRDAKMRMGNYLISNSFTIAGRVIRVEVAGLGSWSEVVPGGFDHGDLQAAAMTIGETDYVLLAANAGSERNRWFGLFRADGSALYAASLERELVHVRQDADGVSLFFDGGAARHIRLR